MDTEPNAADETDGDEAALVRRYYDALDEHEYDALADLLSPEFVQQRPDRTFETRDAFVEFMRAERPAPDTDHELESEIAEADRVAVRGRVVDDGEALFEFADFFEIEAGTIHRLDTYSR